MGSEVEKDGVRGRKRWGQRSKKMGSEVEKIGVRGRKILDACARRPYRKKHSGRLGQASVPEANWGQRWSGEDEGFYAKGSKVKSFSVRVLCRRTLLLNKRIVLMVKDLY